MTLPDIYVPKVLRETEPSKPLPLRYGVGYQEGPSSIGMSHGPYENLEEALDVVPEPKDNAVIVQLNGVHDVILYRWDKSRTAWTRA